MEKKLKLGIITFGDLTIVHNSEIVRLDGYLTKNIRSLLELLIYYRMNPLSKSQIIDLLWSGSHNPESALKFSVFRLRQALKEISLFEETPLIVTTRNGYDLNPDFEYNVDFEEVDHCWKLIQNPSISDKDMRLILIQVIEKMNKPFLISSQSMLWTIPVREYYSNIFSQCMIKYMKMCEKQQKYPEMIQFAQRGIAFERLNENYHYYHILGLIYDRQIRNAIEAYEHTRDLFLQELNADLSQKTKELYKLLLSKDEVNFVKMDDLMHNLQDQSTSTGAFYCEYEVFKRMYQNLVRSQVRSHELTCIVIFEVRNIQPDLDVSKVMDKLKKSFDVGLRREDIYSRINSLQFVVLLSCKNKDNGYLIIQRIQRLFYKQVGRGVVKLYSNLNIVEVTESIEKKR